MNRSWSLVLALVNVGLIALAAVAIPALGPGFDPLASPPTAIGVAAMGVTFLALLVLIALPVLTLALAVLDLASGLRGAALAAATIALAVLLVPAWWMLGARRLVASHERRVERDWGTTLEPMEAFLARYPDAPMSEGFLRLEAAAARVGIDLTSHDDQGVHPDEARAAALRRVVRLLFAYFSNGGRSSTSPEVPPAELAAWLQTNRAALVAMEETVRHGGPIAFETRRRTSDPPMPPLYGARVTVDVLTLLALESARSGDARTAADAIDAAWSVGAAARDRGELFSQLQAAGLDRQTLRALRQIELDAPEWSARLAGLDYRRALLRSLQGEARQALTRARDVRHVVMGPLLRFAAVDQAEALRIMVEELRRGSPCAVDIDAVEGEVERSLASWNVIARAALPGMSRAWVNAVVADLEVELTRKVLDARARRSERGAWPDASSDVESGVCPGIPWRSAIEDGRLSLSLDPGPRVGPPVAFRSR